MPLKGLTVYGRSEQLVTAGAQLLDIRGEIVASKGNFKIEEDSIDCTLSDTYGGSYIMFNYEYPPGKYTFSADKSKNNIVQKMAVLISKEPISHTGAVGKYNAFYKQYLLMNDSKDTKHYITFEMGEPFKVGIPLSGTDDAIGEILRVKNPMLNTGDTTLPWEPYTGGKPSPSPEYPQEIETAGDNGEINVNVLGKNLADVSRVTNTTGAGIFEKIQNGYILTSRGASDRVSYIPCKLKKGVKYTASFDVQYSDNVPGDVRVNFYLPETQQYSAKTFVPTSDCTKIGIYFYDIDIGKGYTAQITNVQVEIGSSATSYEPYKRAQTLTLQTPDGLPGIPVKSGGNYTDSTGQQWVCDEIDLSRGEKVKRVEKTIFDGSDDEEWGFIQDGLKSRAVIAIQNINSGARCNSFRYCENLESESEPSGMFDLGSGRYFRFGIYGLCNSVEEWRTLLQTKPVEVLYILPDSIIPPLSPEEIAAYKALHTYAPNTTITNDAGCEMSLTYTVDTQKYVDKKIAAVSAAMIGG